VKPLTVALIVDKRPEVEPASGCCKLAKAMPLPSHHLANVDVAVGVDAPATPGHLAVGELACTRAVPRFAHLSLHTHTPSPSSPSLSPSVSPCPSLESVACLRRRGPGPSTACRGHAEAGRSRPPPLVPPAGPL
jgi:hypothetical protein